MAFSSTALATCVIAAAVLAPAGTSAHPPPPLATGDPCPVVADNTHLIADATVPGLIGLGFVGAGSSRVVFFECIDGKAKRLGARRNPPGTRVDQSIATRLDGALTWSCGRRTRDFFAYEPLPDGSFAFGAYGVRTPSCASRFELHVPRRVQPGSTARIRIVDQWGLGGARPVLCTTPPSEARRCNPIVLEHAVAFATRRLRATTRGRWRFALLVGRHRQSAAMAVGDGKAGHERKLPTLLATGDSMMMSVDSFLSDELEGEFDVRSDVQLGSALSRPGFWPDHALGETRAVRPSVTVMTVGAAFDGSAMTTPAGDTFECCDEPWVDEYARRARGIMQTYLRRGRGRVFWLTVPMPRAPLGVPIVSAVNRAILRAADGLAGVTVLRMDLLFTANGYRDTIRYRGRDVKVREGDGIHLNVSGTAIEANVIARAIHASQSPAR